MRFQQTIVAWWKLSRVPFLSVGLLPLILGFVLAWRRGYQGDPGLCLLSIVVTLLIMLMTYTLGERNDLEGDRINQGFNPYSGGTRVLVHGLLPVWVPLLLGYGCLAAAVFGGFYLFYHYRTGIWTLVLEGVGILSGLTYSGKPFRWAYRGVGEILIGFCYGWLPIATGFYLLAGFFDTMPLLLSIPVGISIFNVVLINEFPDEEADRAVGKRNLVVLHGKDKMADLYIGLSVLTGLSLLKVISLIQGTPDWIFLLSGIPLILLLWNIIRVWQGSYWDSRGLEVLCRNTLFINLGITLILTLQQTLAFSDAGR